MQKTQRKKKHRETKYFVKVLFCLATEVLSLRDLLRCVPSHSHKHSRIKYIIVRYLIRNESNHYIGTSYFTIKFNPCQIIMATEDTFKIVQLPKNMQWSGKMANSDFEVILF